MKTLIAYQVDAFTRNRFSGNPAGVVLNADGLRDDEMQLVAREFNHSETAFLFAGDGTDCDVAIRYFTPTTEVPTCGHATIAAMYAMAVERRLGSCMLQMRTRIGVLPIQVEKAQGDYRVTMTQGRFEMRPVLDTATTDRLLACLGLARSELVPACPVQVASTGHSKVMIAIDRRARLNAHGPLGGYLVQNRIVEPSDGRFEFVGLQGRDRPVTHPDAVPVRLAAADRQPLGGCARLDRRPTIAGWTRKDDR
jgi:PhzF family phenazine biosynthesis protein